MKINLEIPEVAIREKRLGSITGFCGTAEGLVKTARCGKLKEENRSFSQWAGCSVGKALCQLSMIQDAVVIQHGPIGCSGEFAKFGFVNRVGQKERDFTVKNISAVSSNLEEKDTIYGGGVKLRKTIKKAFDRFNPKAIFVTTSCASGIIGDDIESIVEKSEKELGIPVVYISCEGFRSRVWTTGFDAAFHGILRKIVKPPVEKKKDVINIINFWGSDVFTNLFKKIGLKANYIVPFTTVEQLSKLSEAAASVQICSTLGTYLAAGLEQEYGVLEVKAPQPYGIAGTDSWFRELGKVTGKEKEVEELIKSEKERITPQLEELRSRLKGKTGYITAGAAYGHIFATLLKELNINVIGASVYHHDPFYDNRSESTDTLGHVVKNYGDIPNYDVSNKQSFEFVNVLNKIKPDICITRHPGMAIWGVRLGIPTLLWASENLSIGYQGLINFGERILDLIENDEFVKNIAEHSELPYTDWWMNQNPYSFLGSKNNTKNKLHKHHVEV
ncbi:nitrogenase component 1 [Clostridium sp.]|jgi:nitrogenase molybdenum-iron protein alpha chain|uniref:nitrogenase component 1 n=1 Tax=Clostridium sp. TaxID=1506 RepID=UPI002582A36C|nr:nitrogenase component 1 [Clostridium sp.]MDF2505841.1 nifE2 [Clostridium sp.]